MRERAPFMLARVHRPYKKRLLLCVSFQLSSPSNHDLSVIPPAIPFTFEPSRYTLCQATLDNEDRNAQGHLCGLTDPGISFAGT